MKNSFIWENADIEALRNEIVSAKAACPSAVRDMVFRAIRAGAPSITEHFYSTMMAMPRGSFFLSHDLVRQRLTNGMQKWLCDLFEQNDKDGQAMVQRQLELGQIHSLAQIPIPLIMRGFRELKGRILAEVEQTRLSREALAQASHLVTAMLDLALSAMLAAHVGST